MIDIREHGGSFGGGKKFLSVSKMKESSSLILTKEKSMGSDQSWMKKKVDVDTYMYCSYSASIYDKTMTVMNKWGEQLGTFNVYFTVDVSQNNPLSNVCKLPNGKYIFAQAGDIYEINANFSACNRIKNRGTYSDSGLPSLVTFINKSGQLTLMDNRGNTFFFNASTYANIGKYTGNSYFTGGYMNQDVNQIHTDPDFIYIRNGDISGYIIKITRNASTTTNPISLVSASTYSSFNMVLLNSGELAMASGGMLYIFSTSTLSMTQSIPLSQSSLVMFYDKVMDDYIILAQNSGYFRFNHKNKTISTYISGAGFTIGDPTSSKILDFDAGIVIENSYIRYFYVKV